MTLLSGYLLPTEREPPADAEAISHKLMVRAGLVRQVGAGLWSWMPAGWRVHQRIVAILREEMNGVGGQEILMPVLQPADAWRKTGRIRIPELFTLRDRRDAELVLAMTHEEMATTHIASLVRSYRDLPLLLYHFQTKERDEPRPRAGVLRTREFVMKDAYTFDRDRAGLEEQYDRIAAAYDRICDRCGLEWYRVAADVGMMGGHGGDEYVAPCAAGEDEIAFAPGYAANLEVASALAQPVELPAPLDAPQEVHTPGATTIDALTGQLGIAAGATLKAFPVVLEHTGELRLVVVRGDHRVNEVKLGNALGSPFRPATAEEIAARLGPPGYIGPVGAAMEVLLDEAVLAHGEGGGVYVAGANRPDAHLRGVAPGRDFPYTTVDVREVLPGDTVNGAAIRIERAIEIGHIFKLGTWYSEALDATYLDDAGRAQPVWMGSYGIGPARIAAAAVEQHADEKGISWPRALAPFDVELVTLGKPGSEERALSDRLYDELRDTGLDVLYDERDAGPGEKFADAELLGCPLRLTVGRRTLAAGEIEVQVRRGRESRSVSLTGALPPAEAVAELWRELP